MYWLLRYLKTRKPNFHVVVPGRLYRSAAPTPENLEKWKADHGITTVIDLRLPVDVDADPKFVDYVEACRRLNLKRFWIPMSDREATPPWIIRKVFALLDDPTLGVIDVHCEGGRHRTGEVIALYEVERLGVAPEVAMEHAETAGFYERGHERFADGFRMLLASAGRGALAMVLAFVLSLTAVFGQGPAKGIVTLPNASTTESFSPCVDTRTRAEKIAAGCIVEMGNGVEHHCAVNHGCIVGMLGPVVLSPPYDGAIGVEVNFGPLTTTWEVHEGAGQVTHPWIKLDQPPAPVLQLAPVNLADVKRVLEPEKEPFDLSFWIWAGTYSATSFFFDPDSTRRSIRAGNIEKNPIFATNGGRGVRYGWNAGVSAAILGIAVLAEWRGARRVARAILIMGTFIRGGAAVNNYIRAARP